MPQPEQLKEIRRGLVRGLHRMPLVPVAALIVFGILLVDLTGINRLYLTLLPAVTLASAALWCWIRDRQAWASGLIAVGLIWIGATVHQWQRPPESDDLSRHAQREYQPLIFQAEIISGAVWRPNSFYRTGQSDSQRWSTQWRVHCQQIRHAGRWQSISSFSTLTVPGRITNFLPGDYLTVYGQFASIAAPSNPGQADMRPAFRQQHQFVFLQADGPEQLRLEQRRWHRPLARLIAMAVRSIDRAIGNYVTLGQGPLAAALIFGQRQQVDWDAQQQLLSTGTLHMLAISGMHIELVAGALWILCWLIGLSLRKSLWVVAVCISLYALIAGANPPVLRAVFVVLALCVARWHGRRSGLANLLAFAGLMVLSLRSAWITNVGVQLSFLAVAVIAIFARDIRGGDQRRDALAAVIQESWSWRERMVRALARWIWQMALLSFWVWLFTAPLIWMNFHVVSVVAIPLNILLWPFLVAGLLSGLVLAVGWWLPPLAAVMGSICGLSLWMIGTIVWLGDRLPAGHVWLPAPSWGWVSLFYLLAALGIGLLFYRPKFRWALATVLVVWMLIGMTPWLVGPRGHGPAWLRQPAGHVATRLPWLRNVGQWLCAQPRAAHGASDLHITFVNVGHGTCVILELPGGEVWVYDAGHMGGGQRSYREIAEVLWHLPTARIDRLFVSHADADHYNAIPGLIARFSLGQIVASPQFWQHLAPELASLRQECTARGIPLERVVAGESMTSTRQPSVAVKVLHPSGEFMDTLDNANSLTLLIEYAGRRCLLPGDLEKRGLKQLLDAPAQQCDVLMAPHHGSTTQDPQPIFAWCRPQWIIISGGPRATKPKALQLYSPPGTQTCVTHRDGAVQCRIDRTGTLRVYRWQTDQWERMSATAAQQSPK